MSDSKTKEIDFDNPPLGFRIENKIMWYLGGPLLYNRFIKLFNLKGSENVLDFGCGGGVGSKAVLKYLNPEGHLTCLDTSEYWINVIRKRFQKHKNIDIKLGEIQILNILDSSFDIIFMVYVLHHIEMDKRENTINILKNKLKKDGRLFIAEPTRPNHGIPVKDIRDIFTNAGFVEKNQKITGSRFVGEFQKS